MSNFLSIFCEQAPDNRLPLLPSPHTYEDYNLGSASSGYTMGGIPSELSQSSIGSSYSSSGQNRELYSDPGPRRRRTEQPPPNDHIMDLDDPRHWGVYPPYGRLYGEYMKLQGSCRVLETQVVHARANVDLLKELLAKQPQALAPPIQNTSLTSSSHSSGTSTPTHSLSAIAVSPEDAKRISTPLDRTLFPQVAIWTKDEWTAEARNQKNIGRTVHRFGFFVDQQGVFVGKEQLTRLNQAAQAVWQLWMSLFILPKSWAKKRNDSVLHFKVTLEPSFPWVFYCDNDWKLGKWATAVYPDFKSLVWRKYKVMLSNSLTGISSMHPDLDENDSDSSGTETSDDEDRHQSKRRRIEPRAPQRKVSPSLSAAASAKTTGSAKSSRSSHTKSGAAQVPSQPSGSLSQPQPAPTASPSKVPSPTPSGNPPGSQRAPIASSAKVPSPTPSGSLSGSPSGSQAVPTASPAKVLSLPSGNPSGSETPGNPSQPASNVDPFSPSAAVDLPNAPPVPDLPNVELTDKPPKSSAPSEPTSPARATSPKRSHSPARSSDFEFTHSRSASPVNFGDLPSDAKHAPSLPTDPPHGDTAGSSVLLAAKNPLNSIPAPSAALTFTPPAPGTITPTAAPPNPKKKVKAVTDEVPSTTLITVRNLYLLDYAITLGRNPTKPEFREAWTAFNTKENPEFKEYSTLCAQRRKNHLVKGKLDPPSTSTAQPPVS